MNNLSQLKINEIAKVLSITAKENLYRRFIDIGIIYGTEIKCVAISPQGDPKAYLIRGTKIALRNKDAQLIKVGDIYV